jgi:N-acetyl-anhydromuramyl-L-alanine amidase AmpD
MVKIKNGKINDERVQVKIYPSIEHGKIHMVTSIVLHRTDSISASSTFLAYANKKESGAHFLIDKNGQIYQTANLNQMCWHVGILLSRCLIEKDCDPKELKTITALIHETGLPFGSRARNLSRHEAVKKYPLRYPSNADSIGIEVVGKFWPAKKSFDIPTLAQFKSMKWLVGIILKEYNLNLITDAYAHGAIARKQIAEGAQLLQYLYSGAVQ